MTDILSGGGGVVPTYILNILNKIWQMFMVFTEVNLLNIQSSHGWSGLPGCRAKQKNPGSRIERTKKIRRVFRRRLPLLFFRNEILVDKKMYIYIYISLYTRIFVFLIKIYIHTWTFQFGVPNGSVTRFQKKHVLGCNWHPLGRCW